MNLTALIMSILVAMIGALMAAMPYLMPPTECFAVTVPPSAKADPRIRAIYRRYVAFIAVVSCASAIACFFARDNVVPLTLAMLAPEVAGFAAMLAARSQVRAIKEAEDWKAGERRSAAFVADESAPQPISIWWNLLFLVLAAVFAAIALAFYERFPEQIPMQTDFDGDVSRYAERSIGTVLFPALTTLFMGSVFAISHWMILRSKKPVDPAAPASSALAYGTFARTQSILLVAGGLLVCAGIGASFFASSLGALPMSIMPAVVMASTAPFLIGQIALSVIQGQSGGRIAAELRTSDEVAQDDDEHWLLGSIYFNPADPSFVVPKRFGMGWTMNFGNRLGWLAMAAILIVSLSFSACLAFIG